MIFFQKLEDSKGLMDIHYGFWFQMHTQSYIVE